jgi:Tripartite tricarboxylate transporter TctB family
VKVTEYKDFTTGLLYAIFGSATALGASSYDMGSARAMGPGYFPLLAGVVLAMLGVAVLAGSLSNKGVVSRLEGWNLRKILLILVSLVLFAATLEPLGLVVALPLLVVLSSTAHPEFSWRGAVLLSAFLLPFVWAVFVYFLSMPLPFFPPFVFA